MVDKTIQKQRKEYVVNTLTDLSRLTIDKEKLTALLYNDGFNSDFGEKQKSWTFINALNSGIELSEKVDSLKFSNMAERALVVLAMSQLDDPKKYQTREITDNEIAGCYNNDQEYMARAKARVSKFVDQFVPLFNDCELSLRDIEKTLSDEYFNGMYVDIEKNSNHVARLFGQAMTHAIKRKYIERELDKIPGSKFAKELENTLHSVTTDDFRREIFAHPDGKPCGNHRRIYDACVMAIMKCLDSGYPEYAEDKVDELIDRTIISKFMSVHDEDYRQEFEREYNSNEQDWLNSINYLDLNFDGVLQYVMEKYEQKGYCGSIDKNFIEYFKKREINDLYVRHMFVTMYDLFGNNLSSTSRYVQFINWIKEPFKEFNLERSIKSKIDSVQIPESLGYIRSKARALMDEHLEDEYWRKKVESEAMDGTSAYWNDDPMQIKINDQYMDDKERIDGEILKYFEERVKNKTAHNMTRGILDEDFMDEYAYELIKTIVNSGYDEKTAMQMINDIVKKDTIVEPNM